MRRNLAVTAGLAALGGVVGAVMGVLSLAVIAVATTAGLIHSGARDGPPDFFLGALAAGSFGAGVGSVLAPIAAWSLMRHVPLWKAILQTTAGTALGVVVGYFSAPLFQARLLGPIVFGVTGFLAAAVRLRLTRPRKAEALD
jgi:hypothetical protein